MLRQLCYWLCVVACGTGGDSYCTGSTASALSQIPGALLALILVNEAGGSRRTFVNTDFSSNIHLAAWFVPSACRSLEQFHRIWREKGHMMPVPDHLICGVGTRVYHRQAGVDGWVEDAAWTKGLSGNGWNIEALLEVIADITRSIGVEK